MRKIAFALAGTLLLAAPVLAADPPLDPRCYITLCDPPPPPPPPQECPLPSPDDCSPPPEGCPLPPECESGG